MATAPLLDRQFLERLERLTLHWESSFPGLVGGHNISRFAGGGQEFLDHRNFHHGDDLRAVNWRAYMRLDKLFLKMFQVEPRVPVRILLDASASMTATGEEKFVFAKRLTAALCYVGLVRLDTIVVQPFSSSLTDHLVCTGGRHRFSPVANFLGNLQASGKTGFQNAVRDFLTRYSTRGLLIVISDFLDDEGCEKPLQYLADFGHELSLIQIWSDADRDPPWLGELDLVDAESEQQVRMEIDDAARKKYVDAFDAYCESLRLLAGRKDGRYVGVSTSMPLDEVIFGPLMRARGIA